MRNHVARRDGKFHGDFRQNQQIIESSQRRLQRARELGQIGKEELDESTERLKKNLEDMAEKLQRLKHRTHEAGRDTK